MQSGWLEFQERKQVLASQMIKKSIKYEKSLTEHRKSKWKRSWRKIEGRKQSLT
jgi:hypothetical protein